MLKKAFGGFLVVALSAVLAACDSGTPAQPTALVAPTQIPLNTVIVAPTMTTASGMIDVTPVGTDATPTTGSVVMTPTAPVNLGDGRLTIETTKGRIVLQLFTDPSANVQNTILNFTQKAQQGYFNNLTFHRVEDWVVQGGDPQGTGTGGGDIPSEYNNIPFVAGSLGVARSQNPATSNDSQFFITKSPAPHLTGQYTNWGQVIEGMDVVNQIAIGDKITAMTVEGVNVQAANPEPQRVQVQHILIGFKDARGFQGQAPPKAAARTREQAEALANEVLNRARSGESFDTLVQQYTDDSAPGIYGMANFGVTPEGGEAGRDGMVAGFGNAGFSLEVGEITMASYDEFASPFGWHIVKRLK
jgi:cyclophilin family peptidyl-prolyl cis-trans isomerase